MEQVEKYFQIDLNKKFKFVQCNFSFQQQRSMKKITKSQDFFSISEEKKQQKQIIKKL